MDKPVIILGGGLTGSFLTYRLKKSLPSVPFLLLEKRSRLGGNRIRTFAESDCSSSMQWLSPFISYSWEHYQMKLRGFEKLMDRRYHLLHPDHLHSVLKDELGDSARLNYEIPVEEAVKGASFVIDTTQSCFYRSPGYRKTLTMELELEEEHGLLAPVSIDASGACRDSFSYQCLFPTNLRRIIIKEVQISETKKVDQTCLLQSLSDTIRHRGWKIRHVLREEICLDQIPLSSPIFQELPRVVNLSDLTHDFTGCAFPLMTALIDRMVKTSFRYGELQEVVKQFRKEQEPNRKFFRSLNQQIILKKRSRVFEKILSQEEPLIERFFRGNLALLDRPQISLSSSGIQVNQLFRMTGLKSLEPKYV